MDKNPSNSIGKHPTTLRDLNRLTTDAAVYLAFFTEKSQIDGVKFIYGIEDKQLLKKINQKPIIEARRNLQSSDYIEISGKGGKKLTSPLLVSTTKPLIEYISYALAYNGIPSKKKRVNSTIPSEYMLSRDEETALNIILSSRWFRELIFQKTTNLADYKIRAGEYGSESVPIVKKTTHHLRPVNYKWDSPTMPDGFVLTNKKNEMVLPTGMSEYCYRTENGKLIVQAALRYIADILDDIIELTWTVSSITKISKNMPRVEDIITGRDFDALAMRWVDRNFKGYEKFVKKIVTIGERHYDKYSRNDLLTYARSLYFLCIPRSMAKKLINIGRIELTLFVGLLGSIKTLEADKEYSDYFAEGRIRFDIEEK